MPHYALGLLVDNCLSTHTQGLAVEESQRYLAVFKQLDCYSLHVNQQGLDQQTVHDLKQLFNCPLLSYTVNDCERAKMLLAWGWMLYLVITPNYLIIFLIDYFD